MALVFLCRAKVFSYFHNLSVETFVLGAQKNFLIETVLLSTENMPSTVALLVER